MTPLQLVAAVESIRGSSFLSVDTLTRVALTGGASNPMQNGIVKRVDKMLVMVFNNSHSNGYANLVQKALRAEGIDPDYFVLKARAWGTRIPNMPLVEHKGNYYLECVVMRPGTVSYLLDGRPIDPINIVGFEESVFRASQGGLTHKIVIKTFKCDSIVEIRPDRGQSLY
jgi:hypothetical protein